MSPPRIARRLLRAFLPLAHRDVVVGDLDEEFERYVSRGRSSFRARVWYWRQALRSAVPAMRWRTRGVFSSFARDTRFAVRVLRRSPGFTAVVTLTLALGIAATSAVVTVAHAVLFRALPFADPDRLVAISEVDTTREGASSGNVSLPDYNDYVARNRTLANIAGYTGGSRTIVLPDTAFRVSSVEVTQSFFPTLGVTPFMGRAFTAADMPAGAPLVVILGYRTWAMRFNRDASIIGRSLNLGAAPATIIGVLPESFEFPLRGLAELWLPIRPSQAQVERRYFHWFDIVARLKADATAADAAADLTTIARGFADVDPRYHSAAAVRVVTLQQKIVGEARSVLGILIAAAGCLLLVACANLAGLLLTRVAIRRRDADVRIALGASRGQLVRQALIEVAVLAAPALALGLAAGQWIVKLLVASMPLAQRAALPNLLELSVDPRALAISTLASIAVVLLFGVMPAWRVSPAGAATQRRGVAGGARQDRRARAWFVGIQVALALTLMSGATLLIASVNNLLAVSPGFNTDKLLTFRVSLAPARYRDAAVTRQFHADALDRLAATPGVSGVATISQLPLTGTGASGMFLIDDDSPRVERLALVRTISERYFDVMQIPVVSGRSFNANDRLGAPRVVIVNRLAADSLFGGRAVGRRIAFPFIDGQPWLEVVGVAGNEQFDALDRGTRPVVYFPYLQSLDGNFSVVLRTTGEAAALGPSARATITAIDRELPIFLVQTMDQIIGESTPVFRRRSVLALMALFAAAALTLAAIGVYGIVSQSVVERTREIGVRITLGATRRDIARGVLARGLMPAVAGAAVGVAGSVVVARSLDALLFGVTRAGLVPMIAAAVALLVAVAIAACLLPARRATRIDPVRALRAE